jgi:hypothetical protein
MIGTRRLIAGSAAALVLAGLPAAGGTAAVRPARPARVLHISLGGQRTTLTIRGGWKLGHAGLPRTRLPRPGIIRPGTARAAGAATSSGVSGYAVVADQGVAFRYVTANFNIPGLNCANSTSGTTWYLSWTGLDGYGSDTSEQQGTESYCDGSTQHLEVFFEMYPAAPQILTGAAPGDALQASTYVNPSTGRYSLVVTDLTQKRAGASVTGVCRVCADSSAEVFSEGPASGPHVLGLADFGAVSYTNAAVTSRSGTRGSLSPGSMWKSYSVNMVSSPAGHRLATAGGLQGGTAFLDTWIASR